MKVVVIGGGAAGMMAAIEAAKNNHKVLLFERNEKLGKKIYITGKGRCNCTNSAPIEEFFSNFISNPRFLYSAFHSFTNENLMSFLEERGTHLKVERGNRVFPVSDHASDVTRAFERELKKNHVQVYLNTGVKKVLTLGDDYLPIDGEKYTDRVSGVLLDDGTIEECDAVIVCTGGYSYQTTGSTGDGYRFAKDLGLKVTDIRPSLVPFTTKDTDIFELQGLSLKNVTLRIPYGKKKKYEEQGEMMFTHFGITGPLCLRASAIVGKSLEESKELQAEIDLKPALSVDQLDQRILRDFTKEINKNIHTILGGLLPAKMIPIVLNRVGIPGDKKAHDITRKERLALVDILKHFNITINGTEGFQQAIVTQGGVSVKEVSPNTMEVKTIKNLYFAGEVLDIDGFTGGFNLQAAFSTGFLAGQSVIDP